MKDKVKVLYFVDRMLKGGIQNLVIDWISRFDKNKISVDFLLLDDGNKYELEDTLINLGCKVHKLKGMWLRKPIDFIKYSQMLDEFFKNHRDYKVVHMHSSSKNYMVLKYAKKYGIPVRIAHSHNIDFQTMNIIKKVIGNIFKYPLKKYATNYFACSELAGEWLFGKKNVEKVKIIHNAIDIEKFEFNPKRREKIRKELNIEEKLVIGHVGRYTEQKNHSFLVDIFYEINKKNKDTVLLLVGTGEKQAEIEEKVYKLGLEKSVIFVGFKNNVNEYMWAMDYFVFPSLYEGLGIVLIEAQATGMHCFTSKDVVPDEAKVSGILEYISLKDKPIIWADKILNTNVLRTNTSEEIRDRGYDIYNVTKELEKFYINS